MDNSFLDSLAKGLLDGGCKYVTNFPGFESQNLFSLLGGKQISINEKVAYEMAYGGSLAGNRSVVCMKSVGLNVCADSFLNSLVSGVNAGLVLVVTDDMQVLGSQTRQDSRHYLDFFGGLWFEPVSSQNAYEIGHKAFELSEKFDIPIVIRLTNQFFEGKGAFKRSSSLSKKYHLPEDQSKYIVHPVYWKKQLKSLQKKSKNIETYLANYYDDKMSELSSIKAVTVGCCTSELEKYSFSNSEILEVPVYPLPNKIIKILNETNHKIVIFEQGDDYIKQKITSGAVNSLSTIISNTGAIPEIKYRIWTKLEKFFLALKNISPSYVVSDVTQFTVESTGIVNSCLCFGASVPTAVGLCENEVEYPFVVVGDVSFLHGGLTALYEALSRKSKFGIVIIDNGGSWCTGLQKGITSIYDINFQIPSKTIDYDKVNQDELEHELSEMKNHGKLSILYLQISNE